MLKQWQVWQEQNPKAAASIRRYVTITRNRNGLDAARADLAQYVKERTTYPMATIKAELVFN